MSEADGRGEDTGEDHNRPVHDAARTYAYDRYLAALLAPPHARDDLVVLAAYFGELSRIPLLVRDGTVGEIRLQWWRDAIEAPDARRGHPVADALSELQRRRSLSRDLLLAPIEARSRELYEDGIRDARELDDYAGEAEGAPLRLALAVLADASRDPVGSRVGDLIVDDAARSLALTRLALTLPQHLSHGRLPLPAELLAKARDPRGLGENDAREALRTLITMLAEQATRSFDRFLSAQGGIPSLQFAAFLSLSLVPPYLRAVVRPFGDILREATDISPLSRVTRLWFAHWRGRV